MCVEVVASDLRQCWLVFWFMPLLAVLVPQGSFVPSRIVMRNNMRTPYNIFSTNMLILTAVGNLRVACVWGRG